MNPLFFSLLNLLGAALRFGADVVEKSPRDAAGFLRGAAEGVGAVPAILTFTGRDLFGFGVPTTDTGINDADPRPTEPVGNVGKPPRKRKARRARK